MCFIHSQDQSCACWNISFASTTPCLNTTEFLWSQIHLTIVVQTPFQTRFWLWLTWIRWKLSKWVLISLCWTNRIPIHLKHIDQTRVAYLQSRKRCWHDSSLVWHKTHKVYSINTPLLLKHSLVGSLSISILHATVTTLGKTLTSQSNLKTSNWGPLPCLDRHS